MTNATEPFVPALGRHWLTPLYDLTVRLVGERRFKRHLLSLAGIEPGQKILDLGCGTATLALLLVQRCPGAHVVGVDIDPQILAIARRKIRRSGAPIEVFEGSATDPPFPPASFDRILSTLMLHHLSLSQKRETLVAAWRLLRPGGEIHIADFGRPHNALMRLVSHSVHFADGNEGTSANLRGELPQLLAEAGFVEVRETERWMTPFGTLAFVGATRPRS